MSIGSSALSSAHMQIADAERAHYQIGYMNRDGVRGCSARKGSRFRRICACGGRTSRCTPARKSVDGTYKWVDHGLGYVDFAIKVAPRRNCHVGAVGVPRSACPILASCACRMPSDCEDVTAFAPPRRHALPCCTRHAMHSPPQPPRSRRRPPAPADAPLRGRYTSLMCTPSSPTEACSPSTWSLCRRWALLRPTAAYHNIT